MEPVIPMLSRGTQGCQTGKGAKKPGKRRRPQRPFGEDYYVHHTDKDMLLVFHNDREEMVTVVKRVHRAEPRLKADCGWGSLMPHEILHRVFQQMVDDEGAVPTLCRLAQVCRLWRQVASSPDLWRRVSVSICWVVPNKSDPPELQQRIRMTIEAVIKERLSQVSDFSLHQWREHVSLVLESLSSSCPLLTSLTLSHCNKVTEDALVSVGECCHHLTTLNLQDSQVDFAALSGFLVVRGSSLRCLYLSFTRQTTNLISLLSTGSCPELRLLEVNRSVKESTMEVSISAEGLQASCPKLESQSSWEGPGFRLLHELCLATSNYSLLNDSACKRLLRDSTKLRVLDLRGCYKITPECIADLPCPDIQRLYLGMYCSTVNFSLPSDGCCLLTRRWRHSLLELDLTAQHFCESDLSHALGILSGGGTNGTLQSLTLTGTKVTSAAVRDVLSNCRELTYLDLTSCRNIPRGLKSAYRGLDNIRQCLKTLCSRMLEESGE